MVLGFKKQFEAPILAGTKIHTIREDSKKRWRPEMAIQMATGTRTKNYKCFKVAECISIQRIFMSYEDSLHVSVGIPGRELYGWELETLAKNDGFKDFEDFENYWYPELKKRDYQSFEGRIIHWTPFKY